MDVQFTPVTDYAAVVEGLATNKIDLAWLGGFTFVQATLRTNGGAVPIVQRAEDEVFTSRFIVPDRQHRADAGRPEGQDLRASARPRPRRASLMPRYFLLQAGIKPEKDFKTVAFSGAHDATVAFVAAGRAEAGVLNASVWDKLVEAKNPNAAKVRVLATTPTYYDYNWTVRPGLDPAVAQQADRRLPEARPGEPGAQGNHGTCSGPRKFIPTTSSNYDGIEAARAVGRPHQVTGAAW